MQFQTLPAHWQRIFTLAWQSLCEGSKAIAAVITDADGNILSEGRNQIGESTIPNPSAAHAETEAVRNLDTATYRDKHSYVLYAGLEPCVMCMGTIVMGGIRRVVIAAKDDFGGAMHLMAHSPFIRAKGITVEWESEHLADLQRAMQTIRELLYNQEPEKLDRMLRDFAVHNRRGVEAARSLVADGWFSEKEPSAYTAQEIVDALIKRITVIH